MALSRSNRRLLLIVLLLALACGGLLYIWLARPAAIFTSDFGDTGDRSITFPAEDGTPNTSLGQSGTVSKLQVLMEEPVAGFTIFTKASDSHLTVRAQERKTGHIYDLDLNTKTGTRASNQSLPSIYETIFISPTSLVARYLASNNNTILSYLGTLTPKTTELREGDTPYTLEGKLLPDDILEIVPAPDQNTFLWLTKNDRQLQINSYDIERADGDVLATHPITEWLSQWYSNNWVVFVTKASTDIAGFSYIFNVKTGDFDRLLGDVNGLTGLMNQSGTYFLYSVAEQRSMKLFVYDVKNQRSIPVPFASLPEKCVWSNTNEAIFWCGVPKNPGTHSYPDQWYQSTVGFNDEIYTFNLDTLRYVKVDPLEGQTLDIYKPQLSADDSYLIFNNKRDMSLWSFRFKELGNHLGD